jgi:hypothetical protein
MKHRNPLTLPSPPRGEGSEGRRCAECTARVLLKVIAHKAEASGGCGRDSYTKKQKGHPVSEVPFSLEPPHEQDNNRNQLRRHKASDANTITLTARLAGFEKKSHSHGVLHLYCTWVP